MNKYIQIQTDQGNLLPRPVFVSLVVKLSFSGAKTFHCCVILSGAVEDSAVEESSAYPIAATRKILRLRSG